jgi:hypothetical protein
VWPDNVQETGVWPIGQCGFPVGAAESRSSDSKKYLVTGPIRGFCALQVLTWSLDIGMRHKLEQMERMFVRLMRPAIESALGAQT